uniref:Heat shock protein 75 kDa, mitochondrial n=1 Tax=Plectus sambesii TaxID=2011161 RepID=A0A914V7R3_9BILA
MLGARACFRLASLRAAVRSSSAAFAGSTRCSAVGFSNGVLTSHSPLCCSARRYATQEAHASGQATEKHEFQAETRMLLDIVAKSLYSEQEVFLRELISNASDALEKLRYIQLTSEEKLSVEGDHNYEIRVNTDNKARTLVIQDTGIGMTKQELIDCLGTIARSGSKEFMQRLADAKSSSTDSIIGQFGVGFYSAFMVADSVQVTTRSCRPGSPGYLWTSDGTGSYEISERDDVPTGTTITLHLKAGDAAEFSNEDRVKAVIDKYSSFVTVPIMVNGTRVNSQAAIWTMDKKDVTPAMHEEFYKHITKGKHMFGDDRPRYTLQYKTDSPLNIRALLYVPSRKYSPMEFASEDQVDVALYARRVLIKPSAKELVPRYLRFLAGVVDSEDIPLNLSREMLQMNELIAKLRRVVSGRVIKFFLDEMKKDPVKYKEFYKDYGLFFKEGILLENDHTLREDLAKLLMFESSNFKAGTKTSLSEYVERMQADQNDIYYLYAPSRELAESSPYYEAVKSRNMEVLFVYEPHDELVFLALPQFQMKQTQSVEKWMQSAEMSHKEDENVVETMRDSDKKAFLKWVQLTLGSVRVANIKSTSRTSNYPAVVTVADMGAARHFLRIGQIKDKEHLMLLKPTFEVNLSHPIIQKLMKMQKSEPKLAELIAEQLYDNALVTAGLMVDSRPMISRINEVLTELLTRDDGPRILTP